MTVGKAYKILGKLIAEGHARKPLCVDKPTFTSALELDGNVILDVDRVDVKSHCMIDDDGGTKFRTDGTECSRTSVVLSGNSERCEICSDVNCGPWNHPERKTK